MGQPLEKRNEMHDIRSAIRTVLLQNPQGLEYRELLPKVRPLAPKALDEQIKRQVFKMQFTDLRIDLFNPRRGVYFLVGTDEEPPEPAHVKYKPRPPVEPKEEPDLDIRQRIVPFEPLQHFLSGPIKSPMEWSVDCLAQATV
jgi:hypothetical protein